MIRESSKKPFKINYNGKITLAEGKSRKEIYWKNRDLTWLDLVMKLRRTYRTSETYEEYRNLPKDRRDNIKDVGGFVGGKLTEGRRKAESVINRSLITLDLDHVKDGMKEYMQSLMDSRNAEGAGNTNSIKYGQVILNKTMQEQYVLKKVGENLENTMTDTKNYVNVLWELIKAKYNFSCLMYSTHSHEPENPRLRLVIPLAAPVQPAEYEAIARCIAGDLGLQVFDDTTYQPHRLMYWPSTSRDGQYLFKFQDKPWLMPEEILNRLKNFEESFNMKKVSESKLMEDVQALENEVFIETQASENKVSAAEVKKQGDPLKKPGIIGAFCRTYSIENTIETFLSDVYKPSGLLNRYTYIQGSTSGGLITYNNVFAYSHHSTDPISGKLCNAFDLVRLHKYGNLDKNAKEKTPLNKLPSYTAMIKFAMKDSKVKAAMDNEKILEMKKELAPQSKEEDLEWMYELQINEKGNLIADTHNILLILRNDPNLKGKIALNEFSGRIVVLDDLPWEEYNPLDDCWKDSDEAALRHYIEHSYKIDTPRKVSDALLIIQKENKFHPVRNYLNTLKWDGTKRVETLLIDYLGAEDTKYNRTVTRKSLAGAVARVFVPGIKFDYMLVEVGPQGIGKSQLPARLARGWFSDTLMTVQGKEAYEALIGSWIVEMAEMTATKRADIEAVKHFISKAEDTFRAAYAKNITHFPRQCIFWGTTNDREFLRDKTGNRRFWPVDVGVSKPSKSIWKDLNEEEIGQIWAEALELWKAGEELYLNEEEEKTAVVEQERHSEDNSKAGMIKEYLEKLLPEDWDTLDLYERRSFINGNDYGQGPCVKRRERVCVMEIWVELFEGEPKQLSPYQSKELHDIMKKMEGWEAHVKGEGTLRFGKFYGRQKAYLRKLEVVA